MFEVIVIFKILHFNLTVFVISKIAFYDSALFQHKRKSAWKQGDLWNYGEYRCFYVHDCYYHALIFLFLSFCLPCRLHQFMAKVIQAGVHNLLQNAANQVHRLVSLSFFLLAPTPLSLISQTMPFLLHHLDLTTMTNYDFYNCKLQQSS